MQQLQIVLITALVLLLAVGAVLYNGLVALRRQTQNAFGQIDLQLKRRCDAVPKLIALVQGELSGKPESIEGLDQARTKALNAKSVVGKAVAESQLAHAIEQVFAACAGHEDLEDNEELIGLREAFRGTQNKIAFASQYYNDVVAKYNLRLETFPFIVIASLGHFHPIDPYEFDAVPTREPAAARLV